MQITQADVGRIVRMSNGTTRSIVRVDEWVWLNRIGGLARRYLPNGLHCRNPFSEPCILGNKRYTIDPPNWKEVDAYTWVWQDYTIRKLNGVWKIHSISCRHFYTAEAAIEAVNADHRVHLLKYLTPAE